VTDLSYHTIGEIAALLEGREISPVELVEAQLDRIARLDGTLHSYACVMADEARADARMAEVEMAAGRRRSPLHGVPLGIKDLFWTKGQPTAGGTAIHRDFRPDCDSTAVQRLHNAGAIPIGKLEMTEGAYSDYHPSVTPPLNPWNADYWPGISSSGPAVAVAAGLCYGALASDTGGSIRWPANANGITGLKPTWGRVSRYGTMALAASLDHVGVLTRSAADAGLLLAAIAGPDRMDPTALQAPRFVTSTTSIDRIDGMRIGVDRRWNESDIDAAVQAVVADAMQVLVGRGAVIVDIATPDVTAAVNDWPVNCAVEAAVAHKATYPSRKKEYGPVLASVIEHGNAVSGVEFQQVLLRRMALRGAFDAAFVDIDVLMTPVQPFAPLTLAAIATLGDQPDLIAKLQRFTCPFDMTGHPTITLPGGHDARGMPIGFQLVAAHLDEAALIRAGTAYQAVTDWHRRRPPLNGDAVR
jgi:amidase